MRQPPSDHDRFQPTPAFRERRRRSLRGVTLHEAGGGSRAAMVRDVSARGAGAIARGAAPAIDEIVEVSFADGGALRGIVRWAEGNLFGIEFDMSAREAPAAAPALAARRGD